MRYLVLIGVLVAGAGAYSAYWFQVAGAIEPGIAAWADERRAEGFEVAYGGVSVSGFPFRLVVTVHQPSIGRPHPTRAWRWRAPALAAVAQPWNFRHLILSLDGRHRLAYLSQGVWRELSARAEVPMVSVVLGRDGQVERFAIDLQGLEASASGWSERLKAKRVQLHGRQIADGAEAAPPGPRELSLRAEEVTLPPEVRTALGPRITAFKLRVTLLGSLPEAPLAEALAAWRDDGGTVEVRELVIDWGPLALEASGTLALDAEMRPMGAAIARLKRFGKLIDTLHAGGWIGAGEAVATKVALALMAREEAEGKVARVPVTAQQGRLYLGPLPLLRLAPILPAPLKKSP